MTKKDFELIADTIWESDISDGEKEKLAGQFCKRLFHTNILFSPKKFMAKATGNS